MKHELRVEDDEDGLTLAALVRGRLGADGVEVTWSRARGLVTRGKVSVDGVVVLDAAARVKRRQKVVVDEQAKVLKPESAATIVFEDAHVVVIDKPSGISSVPYDKREQGTAMDAIRSAWRHAGRKATQTPLLVVHRIDKETSGLLSFAKTKLAERELQALFRAHDVERTYLCVAHGRMEDRRIESNLVEDRGDGIRGSTRRVGQGKRAVTHVRAVEEMPTVTLCEVKLETGKTHQIRIHLAEAGHPIVGEKVYIRDFTKKGGELLPSHRLLLHAATLGFVHPVTGGKVQLSSPLPPDFTSELSQLRRRRGK
ncbi:MAG: pseudouridine synthase, RluA family [Myxococcales bacterium]|nr:pseudouridine synthase, RluA family [Myxococcales bacterium]